MNVANMKVGVRIGAGFGFVLMLLAVLATTGLIRLNSIGNNSRQLIELDWAKAEAAHTIESRTRANAKDTLQLLEETDNSSAERIRERIKSSHDVIAAAETTLANLIASPEGKDLLATYKQRHAAYIESRNKVLQLLGEERKDEAMQLMFAQTLPAATATEQTVDQMAALQQRNAQLSAANVMKEIASARLVMVSCGLGAVLAGIGLACWLTRSITRPVRDAVKVAQAVARGHLTSNVTVTSTDEIGQLLQALRDMNVSLISVVGQVRSGADTVGTATAQIAAGNQDLSSRTEEQAASLEETASSMEELTSAVRQNADNAQQANALAGNASDVARKGSAVVGRVVETMTDISASSAKIADITGIIEGIAFQTNILALNAAVEAARAGEQGRGFAVVASEVRSLAQRSSSAAKEIKELITASVDKIHDGSTLAGEAGKTMSEVTQAVARVTQIMGDIAAASTEQSRGIEQVNQAVTQMDQVTQQNAALVEEAAAAATSLEEQGRQLSEAVAFFSIGEARVNPMHADRNLSTRATPTIGVPTMGVPV
ncbi:Methyl-accepting chemotaxis protein I [Burkholderia sp. 8Y]|uniref:methyl-accepting chemotaxis protein n=1 Tax=Burkholderia sp. 8Y TaxID=2653133 RepID=UPI0012F21B77|nr:methyl-accepting chemotaxis protein [Burkholderia sp. 8Y]VXB58212.1 Methyl-accepting chemotaxis protein I [Burkholderia sp. 8Y]